MKDKITNCQFAFECPLDWENLKESGTEGKRWCGVCGKAVFMARTQAELGIFAKEGKCVAVRIEADEARESVKKNKPKKHPTPIDYDKIPVTMGVILPPENLASPPTGLKCSKCGNEYSPVSIFCGKCGTKF